MESLDEILKRHEGHVAFQFSGGRDSTAALYWMRDVWHRMRVYHLYTGDAFPEVQAVVERVAKDVPITIVEGDSVAVRMAHGWPSDLVPVDNLAPGRALSGRVVPIISRFQCCSLSIMEPLHQRMLDDGMTLLVRGTRASEFAGEPVTRSGFGDGRVQLLHPIEDWSDAEVDGFIGALGLPVAPFYAAGMRQAPGCMGCTAWWGEGRLGYMRRNHPERHAQVQAQVRMILNEVDAQLAMLAEEN